MLLLTFLFATFTTISAWTYNLQDAWGEKSPSCNGKQQSPINFITNRATPENARPFNLTGYSSKIKGINLILMNSGHSAKLDFSKMPTNKRPTISDGVLGNATYVLEQIHFHWGGASGRGSEHLIDWKQYDLETHLVHRNAKYKSVDDAIGHEDGLSVLSFLYFSKPSSGNFLKHITNRLPFIKKEGSKTKLRAGSIKLARMFSIDRQSKYFNYIGSLTTPGCDEKVKWIVFPQAQIISSEEMGKFRSLKKDDGSALVDNWRKVRDLNGRKVSIVYISKNPDAYDDASEKNVELEDVDFDTDEMF